VLAAALAMPMAPPAAESRPSGPNGVVVRRDVAEEALGECTCAGAQCTDLYFNRYQGVLIHRVCGKPWSPPRKSPVRITTAAGTDDELVPRQA
jgi:hypothetical protein